MRSFALAALAAYLTLSWASPAAGQAYLSQRKRVLVVEAEGFHPEEASARQDALEKARVALRAKLLEQRPPIRAVPAPERMAAFELDSYAVEVPLPEGESRAAGGKVYKVRVKVGLTADQLRDLRGRDRLVRTAPAFGVIALAAGAVLLALRLDVWTRGYLPRPGRRAALALALTGVVFLFLLA